MTRNSTIDIAKGIGIILVVLGHTDFVWKNFIYQFHLPLFFFLSGYVFNINKLTSFKKFFLKKIKALYLPFVVFETFFLLFHNFFVNIGFYNGLSNVTLFLSVNDTIKCFFKILTMGYGEQLAGPLWFLISTLEINLIFSVLAKISEREEKGFPYILVVITIILYFCGCYVDLPRMLSQSLIGMFFYCGGFIYKKYEDKINYKKIYFICSFIILFFCSFFNTVDISKLEIANKFLLMISGFAGVYFILFISEKCKFLKNKFMLYCGQNTIYILALHCFVFKIVMYIEILIYDESKDYLGLFPVYQKNQFWGIIICFCGVIFPVILKRIIDFIRERVICRRNL